MSDTKHTPGPWSADEVRHDYDQVIRGANRDPVAFAFLAGYMKCVGRANARLISAAPDLLTACEEFVRFSELSDTAVPRGDYIRYQVKALAAARVAIAKAKEATQ